jgi:hypothetical protein
MDDLELVRERLSKTPVSGLRALSKESGVPYGTLWNIKKKKTKNPRYPTVKVLADHYKQKAA